MNPDRPFRTRLAAAAPALLAAGSLAAFAAVGGRLRAVRADRAARSAAAVGAAAAPRAADARSAALVEFASVALGGFRGVLADALWLRAGRMQDERRFVELVQLSDWIAELEPRNEEVWIFHAWNMAYNVSFLLSRPDDRWRWVGNGIALLRDRGIPLNPRAASLKQALGWFFQHKLGMKDDDASPLYRTEWAREIASYLGPDGAAPAEDSFAERELADALRMDGATMRLLERRFGPIDWRVPCASSLYWGFLGTADPADGRADLSCRRMVYQSLMAMARADGRLASAPDGEDWSFDAAVRPNPALAPGAISYAEDCMRESSFSGIRYAYLYFLRDMMGLALLEKRDGDARAFHEKFVSFFEPLGLADAVPPFENLRSVPPTVFDDLIERADLDRTHGHGPHSAKEIH